MPRRRPQQRSKPNDAKASRRPASGTARKSRPARQRSNTPSSTSPQPPQAAPASSPPAPGNAETSTPPAAATIPETSSPAPAATATPSATAAAKSDRVTASERAAAGHAWRVTAVAVLFGFAAVWEWSGLRMILASALDPLPTTTAMTTAIALVMTAFGAWLPEHLVPRVLRLVARARRPRAVVQFAPRYVDDADLLRQPAPGFTFEPPEQFWLLRAIQERDPSLLWVALSLASACAAGVGLLVAVTADAFIAFYHHLLDRFFWTNFTLTMMEWLLVAAYTGPLWIANGLVLTMLPAMRNQDWRRRSRGPSVSWPLVLSMAAAWTLQTLCRDRGWSSEQLLMLGILSTFLLTGLAAMLVQTGATPAADTDAEPDTPEVIPGSEGRIWFALVIAAAAFTLLLTACCACVRAADPSARNVLTWLLLGLGLGLLTGTVLSSRRFTASGCGMTLWLVGVVAALVTTLAVRHPLPGPVQTLLPALTVGIALQYLERAWVLRAPSRRLGFAQFITAALAGMAVGLILAIWWALPALGEAGALAVSSLVLLTLGGLLQIYEDVRPARTLQQRLAVIVASLALSILIFPGNVRLWDRRPQTPAPLPEIDPADLISAEPPLVRHVCLVGAKPAGRHDSAAWRTRIHAVPLEEARLQDAAPADPNDSRGVLLHRPYRWLRLEKRQWDLIYQFSSRSRSTDHYPTLSLEWLTRLARQASPRGELLVDIPLRGMTLQALALAAQTFEHAAAPPATWRLLDDRDEPALRLRASHKPAEPPAGMLGGYQPISRLTAAAPIPALHSLRRDRMTAALNDAAPDQLDPAMIEQLRQLSQR